MKSCSDLIKWSCSRGNTRLSRRRTSASSACKRLPVGSPAKPAPNGVGVRRVTHDATREDGPGVIGVRGGAQRTSSPRLGATAPFTACGRDPELHVEKRGVSSRSVTTRRVHGARQGRRRARRAGLARAARDLEDHFFLLLRGAECAHRAVAAAARAAGAPLLPLCSYCRWALASGCRMTRARCMIVYMCVLPWLLLLLPLASA